MKVISVCLSDIPKEKINVGKNGKKYVNLVVDDKKETDKFGNDTSVYVNQTKEERNNKEVRVYVGNGKTYTFDRQPSQGGGSTFEDSDQDLPF